MIFHGIIGNGTVKTDAVAVVIPTTMCRTVHLYV